MVKNIVLCFDGTRENFGPKPYTNVLKIYRLLDTVDQVCYYQPGIGTESGVDTANTLRGLLNLSLVKNTMDTLFAFSLDQHIMSAYIFLMENYNEGDSVCMFGFSRGAFLARVLTGMIERVGLLNNGLDDMVGMAWKLYRSWEFAEQPSQPDYMTTLIQEFKRIFCRPYNVGIQFQGLFDSVNSVGLFRERMFPCTQRSNIVGHVRHAVSIDERRGKFKQVPFIPTAYVPRLFSLDYKRCELPQETGACLSDVTATHITAVQEEISSLPHKTDSQNELISPLVQIRRSYIGIGNLERDQRRAGSSGLSLKLFTHVDWPKHGSISKSKVFNVQKRACPKIHPRFKDHFPIILNLKSASSVQYSPFMAVGKLKFNRDLALEGILFQSPFNNITDLPSTTNTLTPDLKEKWFPGDHCDIGGGWGPELGTTDCLSDVSLRWILSESIKCGVKFKTGKIRKFAALHPSMMSVFSPSHDYLNFHISNGQVTPPESCHIFHSLTEQAHDRIICEPPMSRSSSMYNSEYFLGSPSPGNLKPEFHGNCTKLNRVMTFIWWVLELLPIGLRIEDRNGRWRNIYVPNIGRSRCIPWDADMHWSVFWRMKYDLDYNPPNIPSYVTNIMNGELTRLLEGGSDDRGESTDSLQPQPRAFETQNIEKCWCNPTHPPGPLNFAYYEALYNIIQWEQEGWTHVPDDLAQLLAENNDL